VSKNVKTNSSIPVAPSPSNETPTSSSLPLQQPPIQSQATTPTNDVEQPLPCTPNDPATAEEIKKKKKADYQRMYRAKKAKNTTDDSPQINSAGPVPGTSGTNE